MRDPDAPFDEPWQAQLFAVTVALNEAGAFAWSDWASFFGEELANRGARAAGNHGYWAAWLAAFEAFLADKEVASPAALSRLAEAWHSAARATPHGQPISLENGRDPVG